MMSQDEFYEWHTAATGRHPPLWSLPSIAEDHHSPPQWESIDAHFVQIEDAWNKGRSLSISTGIGLAMVVTHDCQLDKEWNQKIRQLTKPE